MSEASEEMTCELRLKNVEDCSWYSIREKSIRETLVWKLLNSHSMVLKTEVRFMRPVTLMMCCMLLYKA